MDQAAIEGFLGHDAGVVHGVGAGGDRIHQRGDGRGATCAGEPAGALQFVTQRHEVGRFVPGGEGEDALVERLVGVPVKVSGAQHVLDLGNGLRINDEAAQHALFGLDIER